MRTMVRHGVRWILLVAVVLWAGHAVVAQTRPQEPPPAEHISLTTQDGLALKAAYYPAPDNEEADGGKQTVPIMMLHDYKGSRNAFDTLAKSLQRDNYAIIVPDLRGHGESTKFVNSSRRNIEAAKMRPHDFVNILRYDLPAVRRFLVEKNDAGELNLNRLCIVGAKMGAVLAVIWTAQDWSWPDLPVAKQGRDVKALILISPEWAFKGLNISEARAQPNMRSDQISLLLLVGGRNPKALASAKRLYKSLASYHSHAKPDEADDLKKHTLFLAEIETSLQGSKLLAIPGINLADDFAEFIKQRAAVPDYPWSKRRRGG